jgi:hypothetical protein
VTRHLGLRCARHHRLRHDLGPISRRGATTGHHRCPDHGSTTTISASGTTVTVPKTATAAPKLHNCGPSTPLTTLRPSHSVPVQGANPVVWMSVDAPVPDPAGAGLQRCADHSGGVGSTGQHRPEEQHMGAAASGPSRPQRQPRRLRVTDFAGPRVSPPAQLAAASRAGQLAYGQVRLGPLQVHDPDHRGVVSAQRTSVVYHAPARQRPTGVGPTP